MNKKAATLLELWDPFEKGGKTYQLEIVNVIAALQVLDYPTDLAKKIREVYERSYKIWIPIEDCVQISYKLIALKYEANSIV